MTKTEKVVYCDFCDKSSHDVKHIIQGPKDIAVCNECIDLCVAIIARPTAAQPSEQPSEQP